MLEVSATADAARRLMDALEASRVSPGTGAVSDTRGTVPRELAEAFRALLEAPQTSQTSPTPPTPGANAVRTTEAPQGALGVDQTRSPQKSDLATDAVQPTDARDVGRTAQAQLMSPLELYRTQFAMHMQVFEGKFFSTFRDQAQEQFEQTVKSSN